MGRKTEGAPEPPGGHPPACRERPKSEAMIWFLIGAVAGVTQTGLKLWQLGGTSNHPVQGLVFGAFAGAAFYGTILWLLAKLFSH